MPASIDLRNFVKLSGTGVAVLTVGYGLFQAAAARGVTRGTPGTASDPVTDLGEQCIGAVDR